MKTTKHTPGPWKWDESWGAIVTNHPNGHKLVCPMWTGCDRRGLGHEVVAEDMANARLIAAAPDLLAFARECARADSDCGESIREAARAAIARAEGGAK